MGPIIVFLSRTISISYFNSLNRVRFFNLSSLCTNDRSSVLYDPTVRKICSTDYEECDHEQYVDYETCIQRNEFNKQETLSYLQELFGYTLKEVRKVVEKWPALKFVSVKNAQSNVEVLKEMGFSTDVLSQNPWLITYKTGTFSTKLILLQRMQLDDVVSSIPLLQLSCSQLGEFAQLAESECAAVPHGSRIKYASYKLQCSLMEMCELFRKHMFLYFIPFDRFSAIMDLLIQGGVSSKHILRDMWVFRYNTDSIASRLQTAREAGIRTIKPWMLRSSNKAFANTLRREVLRRQLLGDSSVLDYLCGRLQCNMDTVQYITSKYTSILSVHVSKLKDVLDFVYEEGYTPQHVCQVPRILLHSLETSKARLRELRDHGYNPPTLIVLCKSRREYKQFLEHVMSKKSL
ncbi:transcription termination factor, mitochondrial [Periplaneta americana]|uniref:transcription termination factor, mitochondrial n=1 Tax=Periplaneta americana TaxID=6978 RepID=UPI0037E737C2